MLDDQDGNLALLFEDRSDESQIPLIFYRQKGGKHE